MPSSEWLPSQEQLRQVEDLNDLRALCQRLRKEEVGGLHQKYSLAKFLLGDHLGTAKDEPDPFIENALPLSGSSIPPKRPKLDDSFLSCEEDSGESASRIFEELSELIDLGQSLDPLLQRLKSNPGAHLGKCLLEADKLVVLMNALMSRTSSEEEDLVKMILKSFVAPSLSALTIPYPRGLQNALLELFSMHSIHFATFVLAPVLLSSKGEDLNDLIISCLSLPTLNDGGEGIKSILFPIYFSLPRVPRDSTLPLMEAFALNKGILCSIDNQDILVDSLLSAMFQGQEKILRCSKYGKFLLGVLKNLPLSLRRSFHSKLTDLTSKHSSFLKKSIQNELAKKTVSA